MRAPRFGRADLVAAGVAAGLVGLASLVAWVVHLSGGSVHATAAPLFGHWLPHAGPGTPMALLVAGAVVWRGPELAARLRWRWVLAAAYAGSVCWILSLALVDGWQRGVAGRLATPFEYLVEVDEPVDLGGFAARILGGQPDSWVTHVAGHPPGALLVFTALDRIGLGGGAAAAVVCVLVGAVAAVAVPATVRAVGSDEAARAVVPFAVLLPGAVWMGVAADGLFAGVTAAGIALLAVAGGRWAWLGGVLLGVGVYLSYGLVLMALPALVVIARRWRTLLPALAGALVVVAAFTAAGFWWLDGYHLVKQRYYQGLASRRPYAYWVWANLAALTLSAGPAAAPALRRAVLSRNPAAAVPDRGVVAAHPGLRRMGRRMTPGPVPALVLAGFAAILVADLSGLSKAETERIWLPFAVWLTAGAALLPTGSRRGWLAAQAVTALLVNHLVLTGW